MQPADAPPAGWYPDPEGGLRLRWWEGLDWSDRYRAPPSPSEVQIRSAAADRVTKAPAAKSPAAVAQSARSASRLSRAEVEEIVAEVRQIARSEVDRAADVFSQRAQAATRQFQPLVSEYTNRLLRWLRITLVVVVALVIGWFVFESIAQITILDWLGERIDNVTGD